MDASRLDGAPLFDGLSTKERKQVARWADEIDVPAGYHLAEQGRFAHEFFVILDGTVEVTVDARVVSELGPGDFFGEIALVEAERRTATVTATTQLRAVVMHQREFTGMTAELPAVAERIHAAIRDRLG